MDSTVTQTPRAIISHWSAKLLADPQRFQGIGATYKFIVEGPGGGTWCVHCKTPVSVAEGEGGADCTVAVGAADFIELANRRLNPQVAFLSGKIRLSGDLSLALKLGDLIE